MFQGILIEKDDAGYQPTIQDIDEKNLLKGSVTVEVDKTQASMTGTNISISVAE